MSNKSKHAVEMKIPGARFQADVSGNKTWLWVSSGSQVTVPSMHDLKWTLSKVNFHLQPNVESCYYNNNRIQILGRSDVKIDLKEWATKAKVLVIAVNNQSIQSILGCDLMKALGVELVQKVKMTRVAEKEDGEIAQGLEKWQKCFDKLFLKLF